MKSLDFEPGRYISGGESVFVLSGEIHYFRVPRDQWRNRLEKMKAAGNCVATYVPWLIHEPKEGQFLFDDPQYDIEAFLELCNDVGLWAIVRPGPYQYSELIYGGLPGWLCEGYPQIRARDIHGKEIGTSWVSYLHPVFLEKARAWYRQVVPRLARHQTTRGGSVAAVQFDNELIGVHCWFSPSKWDYHPATMGIGGESGRWPDFLRAKRGSLSAANEAYGTSAASWSDLRPIWGPAGAQGKRRLIRDYQSCYFASIAEYASTLAAWLREDGINVPLVHNSASPYMNSYFQETVKALGEGFLLGSDHYYTLNMNWDQNNPTPKWATKCFVSLEMLRHYGYPPTVFEAQGGSLSDFPPVTGHDAACAYMTNLAFGMKGSNYYIFAGGPNPPGVGATGDVYDYGAAIAPDGSERELYAVQKDFARLLREHPLLARAERAADCNIGLVWEYSRSQYYAADRQGDLLFSNDEAWTFSRKGLMMTAFCAGLSPNLADVTCDSLLSETDKPLMVATSSALAADIQRRLVRFIQAGGKLLLAPVVPTLDEEFRPCTILADFLGGLCQQAHNSIAPRLEAFGIDNVYVNGGLVATTRRPASAIVTAVESRAGQNEIGWRVQLPGGGVASVLGFHWMQAKREHEQMLLRALDDLGLQPIVRCDNPNVWTSLRTDGKRSMLFLLNLLTGPMSANVSYRDPATRQWIDTGKHHLPGISVRAWADGRCVYPRS